MATTKKDQQIQGLKAERGEAKAEAATLRKETKRLQARVNTLAGQHASQSDTIKSNQAQIERQQSHIDEVNKRAEHIEALGSEDKRRADNWERSFRSLERKYDTVMVIVGQIRTSTDACRSIINI